MVNLKEIDGPENAEVLRSHHVWGARLGRHHTWLRQHYEPKTLHELEDLAWKSVLLMKKHGTDTEDSFAIVMGLLRQQYQLNFLFVCHECAPGTHRQDEIVAPER